MRSCRRALRMFSSVCRGIARPARVSYGVFFLTDLCNARCPYCFNTRLAHLADAPAPAGKNLLTLLEYERIADALNPLVQVVFGGGEPFLHADIDQIACAFYERAKVALFSIPTNGSLPDVVLEKLERMASRCPSATFNLQVSLDAVGSRHDELRGLTGCFEKALSVCDGALHLGERLGNVNLVIGTVAAGVNAADEAPLEDFLRNRFGGRKWFRNIQIDQRPRKDTSQAALTGEPGGHYRRRSLISRWYVDFINELVSRQLSAGRMLYRCNAGSKIVVLTPDGCVYPCEPFLFDERYAGFPVLNIRDYGYDVYRLRATEEFKKAERFIVEGKCAPCPWACAAITSLIYAPSNWPVFWGGRLT